MIIWPPTLIRDIARRRAVIMIGSGVSKNSIGNDGSSPPTWREFLEGALSQIGSRPRHISSAIWSGDYLSACEWIRSRLDENWTPYLKKSFLTPAYKPNSVHEIISRLDASIILTPNFDKIYDTFIAEKTAGTTIIKTHYDEDVPHLVRSGARIILKAHGTIDAPDRMIFTRKDYASARVNHASFYMFLDALLLTHTFIVVGCGLDDPDFQLLFENLSYRFPTAQPHYFTTGDGPHEEVESLMRDTRKLKFLCYSRSNNHKELELSLAHLVELVDAERDNISFSRDW